MLNKELSGKFLVSLHQLSLHRGIQWKINIIFFMQTPIDNFMNQMFFFLLIYLTASLSKVFIQKRRPSKSEITR